jgi:hypothetical protein
MNRGSVNPEDLCCLANRHDLPGGWLCWRFVARVAGRTAAHDYFQDAVGVSIEHIHQVKCGLFT